MILLLLHNEKKEINLITCSFPNQKENKFCASFHFTNVEVKRQNLRCNYMREKIKLKNVPSGFEGIPISSTDSQSFAVSYIQEL